MRMFSVAAAVLIALSLYPSNAPRAEGPDGFELYHAKCAKCHNDIEATTVPGRSFKRIKSAVQNVGRMGGLMDMRDDEVKAVADVLFVAGAPEDVDGKELYGVLCAGCHKGIEDSDIKGATTDDIRAAVKARKCNADNAKLLNDGYVDRISEALEAG